MDYTSLRVIFGKVSNKINLEDYYSSDAESVDEPSVESLENLSFEVLYRDIISTLDIAVNCAKWYQSSIMSRCGLKFTYENLIGSIRQRLAENLGSSNKSNEVRQKLFNRFTQENTFDEVEIHYDQLEKTYFESFLECILDPNATKIALKMDSEIYAECPRRARKLMEILADCSPEIETLKLDLKDKICQGEFVSFSLNEEAFRHQREISISLSTFQHLTHLTLQYHLVDSKVYEDNHVTDPNLLPFLSHLGHSCPNLSQLHTNFTFENEEYLALILGTAGEAFPISEERKLWNNGKTINGKGNLNFNKMHQVQFAEENLTPLCKSLQELTFNSKQKLSAEELRFLAYSTGFALRHLRNLKKLIGYNPELETSYQILLGGICALYDEEESRTEKRKAKVFSLPIPEPSREADSPVNLSWTVGSPFPLEGSLKVTELIGVDICQANNMLAIGSMCPELEKVQFRCAEEVDHQFDPFPFKELKSLLTSRLINVKNVSFDDVSPEYRQAVLESIGGQLTALSFKDCKDISISDLAACTRLEKLQILTSSSLKLDESLPAAQIHCDTFLPDLKQVSSSVCLGEHLFLFKKYFLDSFLVDCPHCH